MSRRSPFKPLLVLAALLAIGIAGWQIYRWRQRSTYADTVSSFFTGTIGLAVAVDDGTLAEFVGPALERAAKLSPEEPAAWANLGLYHLREAHTNAAGKSPDLKDAHLRRAQEYLEHARKLAPDNGRIEVLLGYADLKRGEIDPEQRKLAVEHFRRAAQLAPGDARILYTLVDKLETFQRGPDTQPERARLWDAILAQKPDNVPALLARAALAGETQDPAALSEIVERLAEGSAGWPELAREQLSPLRAALAASDLAGARNALARLGNVLRGELSVKQQLGQLRNAIVQDTVLIAPPLDRFLVLPNPSPDPAPPDETLAFEVAPLAIEGTGPWAAASAACPTSDDAPALYAYSTTELRTLAPGAVPLPLPAGDGATLPSPHAVLAADLTQDVLDIRTDFAAVGAGGLALYVQDADGSYRDASAETQLAAALLGEDYYGAWAVDLEMEGDLDLVLGRRDGPTLALRNNRDGTFSPLDSFAEVANLRDLAWADFDQDGDGDLALLDDAGRLHLFLNERAGRFAPWTGPADSGPLRAIAAGDVDADGSLDLVAVARGGAIVRATARDDGRRWESRALAQAPSGGSGDTRLFLAEMDNNGGLDLVLAAGPKTLVFLCDAARAFAAPSVEIALSTHAIADANGDGRLDLVGIDADGRPAQALHRGTAPYRWIEFRLRADEGNRGDYPSDGRVNSFGLGSEVEVRAGRHYQKQLADRHVLHFGLGDRVRADVARIVWPNGDIQVQAEFGLDADRSILLPRRPIGSCPFVFTWNGSEMCFVTDFIWRSPLGLRINAVDTAGAMQTEDWVKIRGDQLVPRDGAYDVRITAELWETHFFDQVTLLAVDHPKGTEMFVDERFSREMPRLRTYLTSPRRPLASVRDDRGVDRGDVVAARDGRHLDGFGYGAFRGIARDHWVQVELPEEAPREGPLWLVAFGWVRPTDSSLNLAMSQGNHPPPRGIALEVLQPDGSWRIAQPDLGFPAGKNKTVFIDLAGVFPAEGPRRARLRTNLEVYWDELAWAEGRDDDAAVETRLAPQTAELRFRGFSNMSTAESNAPELPHYHQLQGTAQRWRDLVGFHTRFGDVLELLDGVDDRYVIMNAGDELALSYPALPDPAPGMVRDFVLIGDGWEKDGNLNTQFGQTVLPLPAHGWPEYDRPPGRLEDDPVYRRYPQDWIDFHTRYVAPDEFRRGLRPEEGE